MMFMPSSFPNPFFPSCSGATTTGANSNNIFTTFDATSTTARCSELSQPSTANFIISCGLIFWTMASYIPQYRRIIQRKSAEGLSTLYILLGACSGVCAVGNILVLPSSQIDMGCCKINNAYPCIAGLLGMVQVVNGVLLFWGVMFLYVYYAREELEADRTGRRPSLSDQMRTYRRARKAWAVLFFVFAWAVLIFLVSAIIVNRFPWFAQNWADFLGVLVAGLACTQWLPQVFTTWHLGHLGSLSVAMLALSTPSTWIFAFSLISRVGFAGWSAWIVYVLVGSMQVILIATAILFAIRDIRHGEPGKNTIETGVQGNAWDSYSVSSEEGEYDTDDESFAAPDENMSLLGSKRSRRNRQRGSLSRFLGQQLQQYIRDREDGYGTTEDDSYSAKIPFTK
ncbi:hypothetical protein ABW19_dt0207525 [Dactylella cylindrospora]|nr:hypothetical protein ABW19_dt0207525 [Dactylella cylindrospora]